MAEPATKNPIEHIAAAAEQVRPAAQAAVAPKTVRRRRAWLFQLYVIVALIAFGALAFSASVTDYFPLDLTIMLRIQSIRFFPFDVLMRFLSLIGFAPQVMLFWALPTLFLYTLGLKWESVTALIAVNGAGLVGVITKLLVHRPRPDANLVHVFEQLKDTSFPSGHVLFYVSFVGFLWFLVYTLLKPGWGRTLLLWVFGTAVVLIGPSRIYLGQHWPSDTLGAYLVGSSWLAITIAIYRWGKTRFFVAQPLAPEKPAGSAKS